MKLSLLLLPILLAACSAQEKHPPCCHEGKPCSDSCTCPPAHPCKQQRK